MNITIKRPFYRHPLFYRKLSQHPRDGPVPIQEGSANAKTCREPARNGPPRLSETGNIHENAIFMVGNGRPKNEVSRVNSTLSLPLP